MPTERQQRILDFIAAFASERGRTPTIREIQDATDTSSTSVVAYHVRKLRAAGLLDRTPSISRGLAIPGAAHVLPGATVIGRDDAGREVVVEFVRLADVAA